MNKYTEMQQLFYDREASGWSLNNKDAVVGSFDSHNNYKDYDYLFIDIDNCESKIALDFGCGPGRNLVKYNNKFLRIDGVDISQKNLDNSKIWIESNGLEFKSKLYLCNGIDLRNISSNSYDIIMSTICMQHICVHKIRYDYFKEFFRILNNNGYITIQMGFGNKNPTSVGYFENNYDAISTNSGCDTRIDNVDEIKNDLYQIGFKNFKYHIRPVGPGCSHSNWIFFSAQKTS
jgi:cyclopropane fatty-acyl-phospholipid synthase-like methyltransferase